MPPIKCRRCLMECKSQSGLKRHLSRDNPCRKVEPVKEEMTVAMKLQIINTLVKYPQKRNKSHKSHK